MSGTTYRLPSIRWDAPILVWGPTMVDYAALERKLARSASKLRAALRAGDWIVWKANGQNLVGRIARPRSSRDYEVYLLNPENRTHIVVVQDHEIVKVRPGPLEILAASA